MKQEKNKNVIIILLIIIIIVLILLYILLATKSVKTNNSNNKENETSIDPDNSNNSFDFESFLGQYDGVDSWGNNLTITLNAVNGSILDFTISNMYYNENVFGKLSNKTASFDIKGISIDEKNEFRYSGTITIEDDSIIVKYDNGQLTSISSSGGGAFMMADALDDNSKTVTLIKQN